MAKKNKKSGRLWDDITAQDFINEDENIIDEDIAEYDTKAMILFSKNVNILRHIPRLNDSLKPVERRCLMTLYEDGATPKNKQRKSSKIVGLTTIVHPHGDQSIYGTMVSMAQPFVNPIPLVQGIGNFGNDVRPKGYAAMRYTEMKMSKYAYDCFFSDYDKDCVETIFNTAKDGLEPLALPSKYPNILINGGFGIATGNAFCVPTFHIDDIIKLTKKLIHNPDADGIFMKPDIPSGCDIVDNGHLKEICDTGTGTLKMRSTITIEENPKKPNVWILRVHNLPWMTDITTIHESLSKLAREGTIPIKDIHDHSYPIETITANGTPFVRKVVKYDIIINKAHDPHQILHKLYKLTSLEKNVGVNFKVVTDLRIDKLNLRKLILSWIDTRREYKRRRINKRLSKLSAEISLLEILITLTTGDNLKETIGIIRNNNASDARKALMKSKKASINSYQADKIVNLGLIYFTKDANERYCKELKDKTQKRDDLIKKIKKPRYIDEEILEELEDLEQYKVDKPRSRIVSEVTDIPIADTDHLLVLTKQGMIKKLPYNKLNPFKITYGAFKNNDYPTKSYVANNLDVVSFFDNQGRFSNVPVHTIQNTEPSQIGNSVFDITRLGGEVIDMQPKVTQDLTEFTKEAMSGSIFLVSLTKNGFIKRTPIDEFVNMNAQKNVRLMKLRDGDEIAMSTMLIRSEMTGHSLLVYTKKGVFVNLDLDEIPLQSKDASGLSMISLSADDECIGMTVVGNKDDYLFVLTNTGAMKRCELEYLGKGGKRKIASYLTSLKPTESVRYVDTIRDKSKVVIATRSVAQEYSCEDIPIKPRKSQCVKVFPSNGNDIIYVKVEY